MSAFHELVLPGLDGRELPLAPLKEQLTLVVNVASECGLTPQYAGLQELHQRGLSGLTEAHQLHVE